MNKNCFADVFKINDKLILRCLKYGMMEEINNIKMTTCPICKRQLNISKIYKNPEIRMVIQVYHPKFKTWESLPPITSKQRKENP